MCFIIIYYLFAVAFFFFFFSSRRRHTRYWRDWSSDVCSSDLPSRTDLGHDPILLHGVAARVGHHAPERRGHPGLVLGPRAARGGDDDRHPPGGEHDGPARVGAIHVDDLPRVLEPPLERHQPPEAKQPIRVARCRCHWVLPPGAPADGAGSPAPVVR